VAFVVKGVQRQLLLLHGQPYLMRCARAMQLRLLCARCERRRDRTRHQHKEVPPLHLLPRERKERTAAQLSAWSAQTNAASQLPPGADAVGGGSIVRVVSTSSRWQNTSRPESRTPILRGFGACWASRRSAMQ